MIDDAQIEASRSDVDEAVRVMLELSRSIGRSSWIAHVRGEPYDLTAIFEETISDLPLTQEQLIDLWAMFMLGAQAARKAHRHKTGALQLGEIGGLPI